MRIQVKENTKIHLTPRNLFPSPHVITVFRVFLVDWGIFVSNAQMNTYLKICSIVLYGLLKICFICMF